jgi:transposase InsO family protein
MVQGFSSFKVKRTSVCKGCALVKNSKTAFPSNEHKSRGILDLVHSDVCGPMSSTLLTSNIYYVSFIDDSSRKAWIYFMKTKDELFSKFQVFKAIVENQIGKKIKILRSHNGGEYTSKEFDSFCKEARLKRELTIPYNLQQNGVAERKNKSIVWTAKAMVHDLDIVKFTCSSESHSPGGWLRP